MTFFLLEQGSEMRRFCPKEGHILRASEIQTKLPPWLFQSDSEQEQKTTESEALD